MAIKTRIQLKNDTEANWRKANFSPLKGELIIYSTDEAHPFCRLKVGDGETDINSLPFVTDGNIIDSSIILSFPDKNAFPAIGSRYNLYVTLAGALFYWDDSEGYILLNGVDYAAEKISINSVSTWNPGTMTNLYVDDTKLYIENGTVPELNLITEEMVKDIITKG